ncbi:unnamed protein product [Medioppia subpectinata]|uniref:U6 snRNA-associated Sm-like protein LSm1 n=1 Tax=Medioppia subpectinata TaxID=1979941 RepID=A0A7R9L1T7_9ACAR|nr:unnamed protein product [Medioppia subpectinata]CAG2113715.1 unnamed protein product [Medioppia subpectinata]
MNKSNNFPGNTSLLEELDKKLMVLLRDGRTLIGVLRSIDQFANLVLHQTIERIYVDNKYGDIPRGIFLIRGENVVLCGEIDTDKHETIDLKRVPVEEILELQQIEIEAKQHKEKIRLKALQERGLSSHIETNTEEY